MRLSTSRMKTYMACPLQAKFRYVDMLPTGQNAAASYGSCVHHALRHYNETRDIDTAIEIFLDVWHNPEKIGVTPDSWPRSTSFGGYRQRGIEQLHTYHDHQRWEHRTVIACEHEFTVPFGEHELHGFVDLIEIKKSSRGEDTLRIVDYKTNRRKPNLTALKLDIQFTVYVYASLQREFWKGIQAPGSLFGVDPTFWHDTTKDMKHQGIWYHLETGQELNTGDRDSHDFERLYRVATEIEKADRYGVYVPDISGDSCVFCDFTGPCGVKIPVESL